MVSWARVPAGVVLEVETGRGFLAPAELVSDVLVGVLEGAILSPAPASLARSVTGAGLEADSCTARRGLQGETVNC